MTQPASIASQKSILLWRNRRVLITGGTGLLGGHLTARLTALGAECVLLIRDQVPSSLLMTGELLQQVTCVSGDIEDDHVVERIISEYEISCVFHLAAQTIVGCALRNPAQTFATNIGGTWNVLEACRRQQKYLDLVLVASSDKAYGNLKGTAYDESQPLQGRFPYDVSKTCADLISQSYAHTYGLPLLITRCGNFFGGGDMNYSRLIPGTIRSLLADEPPCLRSDGSFIRDYLFVEDGVHAYLDLAEVYLDAAQQKKEKLRGEAFNFSYGLRLTALDVVQKVLKAMQTHHQPKIMNTASAEIPIQTLDSSKARKMLNWQPLFGFDEGLMRTISWYQQRHERSVLSQRRTF